MGVWSSEIVPDTWGYRDSGRGQLTHGESRGREGDEAILKDPLETNSLVSHSLSLVMESMWGFVVESDREKKKNSREGMKIGEMSGRTRT